MKLLLCALALMVGPAFATGHDNVRCQIVFTQTEIANQMSKVIDFDPHVPLTGVVDDPKNFYLLSFNDDPDIQATFQMYLNADGSVHQQLDMLVGAFQDLSTSNDYPSFGDMPMSTQMNISNQTCANCQEDVSPTSQLLYLDLFQVTCEKL